MRHFVSLPLARGRGGSAGGRSQPPLRRFPPIREPTRKPTANPKNPVLKPIFRSIVLAACLAGTVSHAQTTTSTVGIYDDDEFQPNTVDKSATDDGNANQVSLATFKTDIATAFAEGRGGVINFDDGEKSNISTLIATYGPGGSKSVTITSSGALSFNKQVGVRTPISGELHLSKGDNTNWLLSFGSESNVTQVGATVLSRSGSATVSITGKVTYNDATTTTAAASVSGVSNGTDDTFYGFKAPAGKTIVSLAFTTTSFRSIDDLAFIASDGGTTPPTVTTRTEIFSYTSTVSTDGNGPLDLKAELNYDTARTNAPVMVLMHPFSGATGHFNSYRTNAIRMRDAGFFVISPAMRGREGSDGVRDNGGVEVYDIYDAVEALKAASAYASYLNPTNISIIGYSGGGGNVMSALTKFPDTFRVGAAYFGMSDYGFHPVDGWYFKGADGRVSTLNASPGNPTPPAQQLVIDSYHARASNLASRNNPYSEIHLYVNEDEVTSPKVNVSSYKDHAVAAASVAGEFDNIHPHYGVPGTYYDHNNNGTNEPNELQYWPHQNPTINQEQAGDLWYRARLLAGQIPQSALNASDELFVAGYVKTKRFGFWLGNGQNAAGNLSYSLSPALKQFTFVKASVLPVTGKLTVDTSDSAGATIQVKRNGTVIDTFTGGGLRVVDTVADGDVIRFEAEAVAGTAYDAWRDAEIGAGNPPKSGPNEDYDGDGLVNLIEFALKLNPKGVDAAALLPTAALVETSPGARQLEFTFRQRTGGIGTMGAGYATAGITYTVQTSADLNPASWTEDNSGFQIVGTPVANGDGTETVTVTVRLNGPLNDKRFVRLKVTPVN